MVTPASRRLLCLTAAKKQTHEEVIVADRLHLLHHQQVVFIEQKSRRRRAVMMSQRGHAHKLFLKKNISDNRNLQFYFSFFFYVHAVNIRHFNIKQTAQNKQSSVKPAVRAGSEKIKAQKVMNR